MYYAVRIASPSSFFGTRGEMYIFCFPSYFFPPSISIDIKTGGVVFLLCAKKKKRKKKSRRFWCGSPEEATASYIYFLVTPRFPPFSFNGYDGLLFSPLSLALLDARFVATPNDVVFIFRLCFSHLCPARTHTKK